MALQELFPAKPQLSEILGAKTGKQSIRDRLPEGKASSMFAEAAASQPSLSELVGVDQRPALSSGISVPPERALSSTRRPTRR